MKFCVDCMTDFPIKHYIGWERAYETMQTAKRPHLLYKDEWNKKQLEVSFLK